MSTSSSNSPANDAATATDSAAAVVDVDDATDGSLILPKPDKILKYGDNHSSVIYLYGDSSCEKIAVCCAGYADDQTIFQSFADKLAKQGNTFVGVICLPGYDNRPDDGVSSWEISHNKDGYSYNDWSNSIRDAVKTIRNESTFIGGIGNTKFTGIFHDWGVLGGTIWLNRTLKEYEELKKEINQEGSSSLCEDDDISLLFKPNNVIYLDVLVGSSKSKLKELSTQEKEELVVMTKKPTTKQLLCEILYKIALAISYLIQRYISKHIAWLNYIFGITFLRIFQLDPIYKWDLQSSSAIYQQNNRTKSISNVIYMAYPYWYLFKEIFATIVNNNKSNTNSIIDEFVLHSNWKQTPILYLYGTKKKCNFHDYTSIALLEREEKLQLSKSKVIPVENAGHYLYIQQQDLCLTAIIKFMDDDTTTA